MPDAPPPGDGRWLYCPQGCGKLDRTHDGCRAVCPKCGYFADCNGTLVN